MYECKLCVGRFLNVKYLLSNYKFQQLHSFNRLVRILKYRFYKLEIHLFYKKCNQPVSRHKIERDKSFDKPNIYHNMARVFQGYALFSAQFHPLKLRREQN